jgi:hypothetical protein
MTEPSQLTSLEPFPGLLRICTLLSNCGLDASGYGLNFVWFDRGRHLFIPLTYPSNQRNGGWSEADEAILRQQEQDSFRKTILAAMAYVDSTVYRLELEQGHYRVRYSLTTTGRQILIRDLLAERGIFQYELLEEVNEGHDLPAYQGFFIEDGTATVVTPTAVYRLWLDWVDGRHTLGTPSSHQVHGEPANLWEEVAPSKYHPDRAFPFFAQAVEGAQKRMRLRRHVEPPQADEKQAVWELHEKEVQAIGQ